MKWVIFWYSGLQITQHVRGHVVFHHHTVVIKSLQGPFLGLPLSISCPPEGCPPEENQAAKKGLATDERHRRRVEIAQRPALFLGYSGGEHKYFTGGVLGLGHSSTSMSIFVFWEQEKETPGPKQLFLDLSMMMKIALTENNTFLTKVKSNAEYIIWETTQFFTNS